ncbi:hypothetical protein CEXT_811661 [Caerostris extrusa]|uniref:Uncharacterized protein n=1 Tax=Caerostris extrusa TaxID=172846 RepID=A0AAV4WUG6_CAEEX|nr:hypothetical protein CEXT_811661 [Caerostris extrusa]
MTVGIIRRHEKEGGTEKVGSEWNGKLQSIFTSKPPLLTELCLTAVGLNHFARGDETGGGLWHGMRVPEWNGKTAKAFFHSKPPLLTALCLTAVGLNHFARGDEKWVGWQGTKGVGLLHKQQNPLLGFLSRCVYDCRGP